MNNSSNTEPAMMQQVNPNLGLTIQSSLREMEFVLDALSDRPIRTALQVFTSFQTQTQAQIHRALMPPPPNEPSQPEASASEASPAATTDAPTAVPSKATHTTTLPLAHTAEEAAASLRSAEAFRRVGDGTFSTLPPSDPTQDYAAGLLNVGRALHHLEESLPNGQRARTLAAYAALEYGTRILGERLAELLALADPAETPVA